MESIDMEIIPSSKMKQIKFFTIIISKELHFLNSTNKNKSTSVHPKCSMKE